MTVSRRYSPRRARFGGHSLHRNGRAPNLWHAVTVVGQPYARVPPTSRLEPSRLLCGETERRPDSSAPSTDALHVDGLHRSSRSIRAHASERRLLQSSRPTDTPGALRAHRLRDLSAPLLSRESEKQATCVACCQIGGFKERRARCRDLPIPFVSDPREEINEIRLWRRRFFFHRRRTFRPTHPQQTTRSKLRLVFRVWVSRALRQCSPESTPAQSWACRCPSSRVQLPL